MTHEAFLEEAKRRFGPNARRWKFVCPACGTVHSVQQLIDAVLANGGHLENVQRLAGSICIGRLTGKGDQGIHAKNRGETWDKGCNWTLGGLLRIHTLEVIYPDGTVLPTFELAESPGGSTPAA